MPEGPAGGPRWFSDSDVEVVISMDEAFTASTSMIQRDLSREERIEVEVTSGISDGIDEAMKKLSGDTEGDVNNYVKARFSGNPTVDEIKTVAHKINKRRVKSSEILITSSTPTGPAGVPRPLSSSQMVVSVQSDISDSPLVDATAKTRRDEIELAIRDEFPRFMLDVKFTPASTLFLTRKQSITMQELDKLESAIEKAYEKLSFSMVKAEVIADGV